MTSILGRSGDGVDGGDGVGGSGSEADVAAQGRLIVAAGRAVGTPVRYRILQLLAAGPGSCTVEDLRRRLGINHNAVRRHLRMLVRSGLVEATPERTEGRGRPRHRYRLRPEAARWLAPETQEMFAVSLARARGDGAEARRQGRLLGREFVRRLAPGATNPVEALSEVMRLQGFDPSIAEAGGNARLVLGRCAFAAAAAADPETVCSVHRGIAEGVIGPSCRVELSRADPDSGRCEILVRPSCERSDRDVGDPSGDSVHCT